MSQSFTDVEIEKLRKLLKHEGLEQFLPYADQAAAEAKLSSAKRLVWRTYRQIFIALVALIVAFVTLWENVLRFIQGITKWIMGL